MEDGIFSINGRIKRSTYLLRWACIKVPYWIIKAFLLLLIFGLIISESPWETAFETILETNFTTFVIIGLIWILTYIIQLCLLLPQIVKRLHDMNQSGWLALLVFLGWIPSIGWVFTLSIFLILIAVDGTVGENKYGEDPKQRIPYAKYETN
jgi:Predicted membrane protein